MESPLASCRDGCVGKDLYSLSSKGADRQLGNIHIWVRWCFIACCILYKFHMESKLFWTRYLLRANTLIRSVLFCCFPEGELLSKRIILGLHITVLLISKLSFGWRLPSLWGKGFCVSVGGCTIFSQQKGKAQVGVCCDNVREEVKSESVWYE